jgi:hypothetical protein
MSARSLICRKGIIEEQFAEWYRQFLDRAGQIGRQQTSAMTPQSKLESLEALLDLEKRVTTSPI